MRVDDLFSEASDPCWKGYHQIGTKKKAGRTVPNCVPKANEATNPAQQAAIAIAKKKEQGVAETNVAKYKDLGANDQTTHFIKSVTTGKIVSPHRSRQDAEDALVASLRDSNDEFKIVRARKSGVAEGEYDSRKPFGVRYKVFAGREGRVTTKEYWTTSEEKLEKAVAKIEALGNFYEIDGYSYPKEQQGVAEGNLKEFAPVGGDDREPNEEEILRQLASMWWLGTEQEMAKAQKTLAAMGWDIGQDESGDDDAGVFVIRAGDANGDSYIAFNHSDLELNEGAPIVVALAPIDVRNPKQPEPTKVRYQGDIIPPTQAPSTEKRGVKGRPGQRPMPEQGVAEVSKATLDRYVPKAVDAHRHADFSARMSKDDPTKRSYHVDQKKTAEKRRQGISRALDRMSKDQGVAESSESLSQWEDRMKKLGYKITKNNKTATYHAWEGTTHKDSHKARGVAEGKRQVEYFKHVNEGIKAWKKQVAEDNGGVRLSRNAATNSIIARDNKNRVVGIFEHNLTQGNILEDSNGVQVELKDGHFLNMRIVQSDNKIRDVLSYLIRTKDFKTLVNLKTIDNQDVQSLVKNLIDKAKQSQVPGKSSQAQVAPTSAPMSAPAKATAAAPVKTTAAKPAAKKAGWTLAQPTTQHYNGWADWEARGKKFANKTKQTVTAGKTNQPPEQDYGDDFQAMVMRVKKLAGMGPLKTVWDPEKRVYRNVPANPPKENNK